MWNFQYGFRSSRSTADFVTVVTDTIARAFKRSGATQAATLHISKVFDRVWNADLHKLKSYGISGKMFGVISSFAVIDGFKWFWMESLQLMLPSILMVLLSTPTVIRHMICDNNCNWHLKLNLIFDTVAQGRKWLVDFNAGKTQLVLLDWCDNNGSNDAKMDGSVFEEKSSFMMLVLTSFLGWIRALTLLLLLKLPSRKLEP